MINCQNNNEKNKQNPKNIPNISSNIKNPTKFSQNSKKYPDISKNSKKFPEISKKSEKMNPYYLQKFGNKASSFTPMISRNLSSNIIRPNPLKSNINIFKIDSHKNELSDETNKNENERVHFKYHKHYGNEKNCPNCQSMFMKVQLMEIRKLKKNSADLNDNKTMSNRINAIEMKNDKAREENKFSKSFKRNHSALNIINDKGFKFSHKILRINKPIFPVLKQYFELK